MRTRPVALALVACWLSVLVVLALSAPAAANTIEVEHALGQTPDPGDAEIDVETRYRLPRGLTELEVTLPEGTDVYESEGFRPTSEDGRTYEWTGTTDEPRLRYAMEGNVTLDGRDDEYVYAVAEEWAVVRTPTTRMEWEGLQADVDVSARVDGEGVAGRYVSYLGPYEERVRETPDQRFRLVVADAADLREDPEVVLGDFEYAARRLEIGQRDGEVFVVVVPSAGVEWAATGVQRGDADMWVRDSERLSDPKNTWIHEYVHTLQEYERTERTRWSIEGMADYYAALVAYERGHIDYRTFRQRLAEGRADDVADVRLVEPATWRSNHGNYDKGALVFGHLDRRLRAEADSTLEEAIAEANGEELTHEAFLDAVEAAGGSDIRADAERYTETTGAPPVWSHEEHVAAFGGPRIHYEFDSFTAAGPYRETAIDGPRVVAGETLEATVRVHNREDRRRAFTAALRVDGDRVERRSGTLAPDETTTLTFEHAFETPGEYDLAVGPTATTAVVEAPADIEVTDLDVEPTDPAAGERVTLRAAVEPTAEGPAAGEVTFAVDGEPIANESVRAAGGTATVETTTTFEAPGEYAVSAGGRSATVTVGDGRAGSDGPVPTAGSGASPGAAALAALLYAALLGRRR